jgi:VWFA-related protein
VLTTYATISEFVRRMARLPGQHTMILVSPGFLPIEEEARTEESRLINLAAESSVTINALDARGLATTSLTASTDIRKRDPVQMADYRDNEMRGEGNAMGELADATGGMFFHNNNDLAQGFGILLKAAETVYVLELPLDGMKQDGAWHRLSVKVDRAGTHIQARQGYFAPAGSGGDKPVTNN